MAATSRGHALPFEVAGKNVLVYSLGMEGRDLARFMVERGAHVTVSDTRTAAQLEAAKAVAPHGVERVVMGQELLAPDGFDLVAVSQSVLRYNPAVLRARELGIPFTSQMRLFLQLCRGKVIGITGSSGKSTTTALVTEMAKEAGVKYVSGGNIGTESVLGLVDEIDEQTTVILEISHTQLQYTDRSPAIAAITNVTPNHLDQFNWEEYVGLKRNILNHQTADDTAVLNADDLMSRSLMTAVQGRLVTTSIEKEVREDGAWLEGGKVVVRKGRFGHVACTQDSIRLRGRHNLSNVVMAAAIATEAGFPREAMQRAVSSFRGVPHRLEVVGHAGGAVWVNDSIATSPERTVAGLAAFTEPVVLLLGGREKNLPLDGLQQAARTRCRAVVCFGEAAKPFSEAMKAYVGEVKVVTTLGEAVETARGLVKPGDAVLLSPGGTSFDAYPNFESRGEEFRALVRDLAGFSGEVQP